VTAAAPEGLDQLAALNLRLPRIPPVVCRTARDGE
jgi:hypothetical protein